MFWMGKKKLTKLVVVGIVFAVMFSLIPLNNANADIGAGGEITNSAPVVKNATGVEGKTSGTIVSKTNEASESEYFTGTVEDTNGEQDILWVNLSTTYSGIGPWSNDTSTVEYTSEPGSGPGITIDGITVWNATPNDGILNYKGRITWGAGYTAGTYTQTIMVTDDNAASGTGTNTTQITAFGGVTYVVVDHNNATLGSGIEWNFGSALPGAANVNSIGWLRAYNSGYTTVTLIISIGNFTNAGSFQNISVYNYNMKFRANSTTDLMNDTANTAFGSGTNGTVDGAVPSERLSLAPGAYMFFEYRILAIPSPIPDMTYTATAYAGYT